MPNNNVSPTPSQPGQKLPSWLIVALIVGIVGFSWWQNNHALQPANSTGIPASHSLNQGSVDDWTTVIPEEDAPTSSEVAPDQDLAQNSATRERSDAEDSANAALPAAANTPIEPRSLLPLPPTPGGQAKSAPTASPDRPRATGPLSGMRTKPAAGEQLKGTRPNELGRTKPAEKGEKSIYQIENQTIRDLNGRVAYKGTIDLQPTLERIDRGEANRHRNDGSSFQNRENRLPRKSLGYYKEYVHPTPGENGPGPQRIIIGKQGDVWYTPDHYKSFKRIK